MAEDKKFDFVHPSRRNFVKGVAAGSFAVPLVMSASLKAQSLEGDSGTPDTGPGGGYSNQTFPEKDED